ncbi:MAG TPA: DMT family transporter [candidate division Zixibacteria bacterium]|nr:DMT family transporter [candidate division Zixibacteria bacterium]
MPTNRGIAKLCFGAFCISFSPIFAKMLGMEIMSPTSIAFWRAGLGALILFFISIVRKKSLMIDTSIMVWVALAGFLFSVDLFFWHRSIVYSGAGIATILANTQVFGTAVLSFFIFKEKLSLKFVISAIAAFGGVALLIGFGSEIEMTARYLKGVLFGLITGLAYANYLVTLKYASHKRELPDFVTLMAWVSLFMALFLGISAVIENRGFFPPDLYSLFILILLALVAQAFGWWSISSGLSEVTASRAGLIILFQPVLAMLWGIIIFKEELTLMQLLGAAVTLAAIYFGGLSKSNRAKPVVG